MNTNVSISGEDIPECERQRHSEEKHIGCAELRCNESSSPLDGYILHPNMDLDYASLDLEAILAL